MIIKSPKHSLIVLGMSWSRYRNECKKRNNQSSIILADTSTELEALWGIGKVVHANFPRDPEVARDLQDTRPHVLFLIANSAPLSGQRTGQLGYYVVHQLGTVASVDPNSEDGYIDIEELAKDYPDLPVLYGPPTSLHNGDGLSEAESIPLTQPPVLNTGSIASGAVSNLQSPDYDSSQVPQPSA